MDEESLNEFLQKYSDNDYTEQEHQEFISWINTAPIERVQKVLEGYLHLYKMRASEEPDLYPQLIEKIETKLNELNDQDKTADEVVSLWSRLRNAASVAAVVFIITASGIYFLMSRKEDSKPSIVKAETGFNKSEIIPGGNKAVLTLANGSKIILDNAKKGVLATQAGINIRKTSTGQVIYDASGLAGQGSGLTYNTITTPRGGQYQVVLPDGSKVWLNASSSLKFPTCFRPEERSVELIGEAYFEVAKVTFPGRKGEDGARVPFKVKSRNQTVEVLGTHFNINAYPDEPAAKTTLLEGSVKISPLTPNGHQAGKSQLLKPGQQARVDSDIQVSDADVNQAIAWKNGYFIFSHENIESIMRQISRWYNVDIEYEGKITQEGFTGSVSRFENVSEVLDMLQLTGSVHFKTEEKPGKTGQTERRIIVMP